VVGVTLILLKVGVKNRQADFLGADFSICLEIGIMHFRNNLTLVRVGTDAAVSDYKWLVIHDLKRLISLA
jgi:hypothetical protein